MERAECRGRGEPDEGGVKAALSRVASDCYEEVSIAQWFQGSVPTLFEVRREAFLYSLFRSCFACEPMRTRSPTFLMPMSLR
jgi:hypothetical protein